jgi:hypothetical protein
MRPIGSPETSVLNQRTVRNNPEDGRIHFNRGESLPSRVVQWLYRNKMNQAEFVRRRNSLSSSEAKGKGLPVQA